MFKKTIIINNKQKHMTNYVLGLTILGTATYGIYYYGINMAKNYIGDKILSSIIEKEKAKFENTDPDFRIFGRSKSAVVVFNHIGKDYKIHIPYDKSKTRSMMKKKVFLIRKLKTKDPERTENEKIEITHKPGIPYLLTAKEMNGLKIIVEIDTKLVKEYQENEAPKFLLE